jgi:hypothetical protein
MNSIEKQLKQFLDAGDFSRYMTYLAKVKTDLDRSTGMVRDKKKNRDQLLDIQKSQLAIAEQAIKDEEVRHEELKGIYNWGMQQLATDKNRTKANNMVIALESDLKNLNKAKLLKADQICEEIIMLDPTKSEWVIKFKATVQRLLDVSQESPKVPSLPTPPKPIESVTLPRKRRVTKTIEVEEDV